MKCKFLGNVSDTCINEDVFVEENLIFDEITAFSDCFKVLSPTLRIDF